MPPFTRSLILGPILSLFACLPVPAAQAAPVVPPAVAPLLDRMRLPLDSVSAIGYQDEAGAPIDAQAFTDGFNRLLGFTARRVRSADGKYDVTLRLQSRFQAQTYARLKVGDPMPVFHLSRLDGTPVDNTVLRGRFTLVTFGHGRCEACAAMAPMLNALAVAKPDMNVLAFTTDAAAVALDAADKQGLRWPVVAGAGTLLDQIGAPIPSLALFDPRGRLVAVQAGAVPEDRAAALGAWLERKIASASQGPQYMAPPALIADIKSCPDADYPELEVRQGHRGSLKAYLLLDSEGRVKDAKVTDSTGYPKLDQATIAHFSGCRFKPILWQGAPVETWAAIGYTWTLEGR